MGGGVGHTERHGYPDGSERNDGEALRAANQPSRERQAGNQRKQAAHLLQTRHGEAKHLVNVVAEGHRPVVEKAEEIALKLHKDKVV